MPRQNYQTVKDVADLLKVNEVTVRRWIKTGELRAIDIGKGWRIGSSDLEAFLVDHATRPSARVNDPMADHGEPGQADSQTKDPSH